MLSSMEYLGYRISAHGSQPTLEKVEAVQGASSPQDATQLKSFLGLVNYYGKFIHDLSSVLSPHTDCFRRTQSVLGENNRKQHSKR